MKDSLLISGNITAEANNMAKHVEIEGIFASDCGSRDDTLNLINKVIVEMSIAAEEAAEYHFLGSPSVRVSVITDKS